MLFEVPIMVLKIFTKKRIGGYGNRSKNIQRELLAIQKGKKLLEHQRKICCPPLICVICVLPPCMVPRPCTMDEKKYKSELQLRELREQYDKLQGDFKIKFMDISVVIRLSLKFSILIYLFN